jgi:hypothetical protein
VRRNQIDALARPRLRRERDVDHHVADQLDANALAAQVRDGDLGGAQQQRAQ